MVIAIVSTSNFDFVACGKDEAHARRVLAAAWRKHKQDYDGVEISVAEILEDAHYHLVEAGTAIRDDRPIVRGVR